MSETSQNKSNTTDEIDLLDLLKRMGSTLNQWGKAIGRAFLISVVFLLRRWIPLGISIIIGVSVSYLAKTSSVSFYKSDLVLKNNFLANTELISYINKLHTYCIGPNKSALASALSLNSDITINIIDIGAYWIIDKGKDGIPDEVDYLNSFNIYDTTNIRMKDRLDIRVIIKSPQELILLQNAIISYIKKDSLFQHLNRVRISQNQELLTRYNKDILQLDSLQKVIYFDETRSRKPQAGGQMIFLQEQKTQLVYTDIYSLYAKKQLLEAQIDLYSDIVTVFSDFTLPAKAENDTFYYYGKHYIPQVFGIALIILIIFANRKKLKEVYKKY